jgi:hypothetical protein
MPEFGVNQSNALNAISKVNFTLDEYFNEFIGGLSSEAKSYIKVINNHSDIQKSIQNSIQNSIIIYGDDNGFTEDNRNSFTTTYDSNGYGLGEHGQGCRAAFNEFMKLHMRGLQMYAKDQDYFFGIISYNTEIGWTVIKITFNYNKKDFCIEYNYDNENNIYQDFFRKNIENTGTMFIIPNIFKSSILINDCIVNYKKMLNYRIHNDNLKFYFNNNIVVLNHSLISEQDSSSLYQKFKILPVRARKKDIKRKGKICDMFQFEPDPFNNENSIYHFSTLNNKPEIYTIDQVEIDDDNTKHKYLGNNVISCEICNIKNKDIYPHHENDYNIVNLAHDCGFWIYKKKILINMKPFGTITRGEGSGFTPQISFHVDNIDLLKTEANKSKLKMANINQPFATIMKYIKDEYKILYLLYKRSLPNPQNLSNPLSSDTPNHPNHLNHSNPLSSDTPNHPNHLPPDTPNHHNHLNHPNPLSPDTPSSDTPSSDTPSSDTPSPTRNNIPNSIKNISLYEQYKPRCIICDKLFSDKNPHEACHIKSDKNGGTNDKKNTLIACFQCNRNMSSHNMMEWIASNWEKESSTYKRVYDELIRLDKNIF